MHSVNRPGFSTVELIIGLVIAGVVASSLGTLIRRQQRFFTGAALAVERRASLRDATAILQSELRAISPVGGDVLAFSDSALEMRATIGAAIACDTVAGGAGIDLAPVRSAPAPLLAGFSTSPQPGDVALVFDPGASATDVDDSWTTVEISSTASLPNGCLTSPLLDPATDGATSHIRLRFTGNRLPATIGPGAFVRVLRRVRYRLYRSGTSEWYLGYAEWDGTAFGVVQPVSGPFASYSRTAGSSGLALRYFDDSGAELSVGSDASRIARVEVVARAAPGIGLSPMTRAIVDSQAVTVRVRNR